uniref:ubiquitinyl hydrolase 1 n=1 Tax=Clastoptera arizonana TaxID=38151 RepID=A0A1B6E6S3_9HEMI
METVFHEKQEGSLCAQHCLNALLQGNYFTAVDLASLAQNLDDEERKRMAESGVDSEEYRQFIQQPSGNMDDSGYFSVQVISSALEVWGLELVPYNSTEHRAIEGQENPCCMQAYICNYRDHWFTIRKIANQWLNLNSLLSGPELISNTYLSMFLAQLQQEGYSIFIVFGDLPECTADSLLLCKPAVQNIKSSSLVVPETANQDDDSDLQRALMISLQESSSQDSEMIKALRLNPGQDVPKEEGLDSDDDEQIRQALLLSLQTPDTSLQNTSSTDIDAMTVRQRRLAYLEKAGINT